MKVFIQFVLFCVAISLFSAGCTSRNLNQTDRGDLSSRNPDDDNDQGGLNSFVLTSCNTFAHGQSNLTGIVRSYYTQNDVYVPDLIRVKLQTLPVQFDQNDQLFIQFFRWRASEAGDTYLDPEPLDMIFEDSTTGMRFGGPTTSFDYALFTENRAGAGFTEFFSQVDLIISGTTLDYDALRAVMYENETVVAEVDILIPEFDADPNEYAIDHPDVLNTLHPNYGSRDESWSRSEYLSAIESKCF